MLFLLRSLRGTESARPAGVGDAAIGNFRGQREIATIPFGNPLAAACDVGMVRPASELGKENARRKEEQDITISITYNEKSP